MDDANDITFCSSVCFIYSASDFPFLLSIGDTFTDGTVKYTMTSMNVPEPVMSLAVSPISKDSGGQVYHFLIKRIILLYLDWCLRCPK